VLSCVAVCCSMLQCVPVNKVLGNARGRRCVAVCCCVLPLILCSEMQVQGAAVALVLVVVCRQQSS